MCINCIKSALARIRALNPEHLSSIVFAAVSTEEENPAVVQAMAIQRGSPFGGDFTNLCSILLEDAKSIDEQMRCSKH